MDIEELQRKASRLIPGSKLERSTRMHKKFKVTLPSGKTVHFGDNRYEDFTTHRDENRRRNFRKRFKELYEKSSADSPIYWAWNLLW